MSGIKIKNILSVIEDFAPLVWQEDYDNAGLIVGNSQSELKGVLICLDVFPSIVQEAIDNNCNLIISHHPFIFRGIKKLIHNSYIAKILSLSFNHNVALYASHTNMDACSTGVNYMLAEVLGLKDLQPLQRTAMEDKNYLGIGAIGTLGEATMGKKFFGTIKEKLNLPCIKYVGNSEKTIKKVGICGGAGAEFIPKAMSSDCDCYLTGDIKYHDFLAAEDKILLADIGHFESEQFVLQRFAEIIRTSYPQLKNIVISKTNKIKYYL